MIHNKLHTELIPYKIEPATILYSPTEDKEKTTIANGYKITCNSKALGYFTLPCYFLSASYAEYILPKLIEFYNEELFKLPKINTTYNLYSNIFNIWRESKIKYEDALDNESEDDEVLSALERDENTKAEYVDKVETELILLIREELEYRFSDIYNSFFELFPQNELIPLKDVPVGLFIHNNELCFANEYGEYFIVNTGEVFWGGTNNKEDRAKLIVQPVKIIKGGHINE